MKLFHPKVLWSLMIIIVFGLSVKAQDGGFPEFINYQAVAYDDEGRPMQEQTLDIRISILKGEPSSENLFSEIHEITTDDKGRFALRINNGTTQSGNFTSINWATDYHFLKVEIDKGEGYKELGIQQLVAVPYAMVSKKASDMKLQELSDVEIASLTKGQLLVWDGNAWKPATFDDNDQDFDLPVDKSTINSEPFVIESTANGSFATGIKGVADEGVGVRGNSANWIGVVGEGELGGYFDGKSKALEVNINGITSGGQKARLVEAYLGRSVEGATCKGCPTPITNYGIWAKAIGGTTNYAGWFEGDVHISGTLSNPSDEKLKASINELPAHTLDKVLQLKPVNYMYKRDDFPQYKLPDGMQIGFVAQDVERVFPQLVRDELKQGSSDDQVIGFKSLNYIQLVPVLTKALQEQQQKIDDLEKRIARLEKLVDKSNKP